jgi:hypothetical protein
MSSPELRPRNNQPAAGGKKGPQQSLRVLSAEGAARAAAPGIAMPRATTELSVLLAGDPLLCVRRRASAIATGQNDAAPGLSGADSQPQAESPAALAGQRGPDSAPQAHVADKDLDRVIDVWPGLPRNVRAAILAMVHETSAGEA